MLRNGAVSVGERSEKHKGRFGKGVVTERERTRNDNWTVKIDIIQYKILALINLQLKIDKIIIKIKNFMNLIF